MNRRFAALLAAVLGVLTLRITLNGQFLNFVRAEMLPWLLLSGVVLIALGLSGWVRHLTRPQDEAHACLSGHSHSLSRAAWLLVLVVLLAGLLQPAPLGSFAAQRQSMRVPRQLTEAGAYPGRLSSPGSMTPTTRPSAPAGSAAQPGETQTQERASGNGQAEGGPDLPMGAVLVDGELSLLKFLEITYYDETQALADVPLKLVGFVVPDPGAGNRFMLSRFLINCCAADATLMQVGVRDVRGRIPAQDSWVVVTGHWDPERQSGRRTVDGFPIPDFVADRVDVIEPPRDPYLSLGDL